LFATQDNWTPLLHAVKLNALDSVECLLKRGADAGIRNMVQLAERELVSLLSARARLHAELARRRVASAAGTALAILLTV
jgi:hypothetical protein